MEPSEQCRQALLYCLATVPNLLSPTSVSADVYWPGMEKVIKNWDIHSREQTCLRLPFQVSTNMSTLYRRFPGECIATFFLHIDPKTANMSQFLQLGPLDFDPDLGYVRYFWGIDSANNHSHISKPHPLNNTDTLSGRFPWLVIQPLVNATCFWNAPPIFLPTHEHHL